MKVYNTDPGNIVFTIAMLNAITTNFKLEDTVNLFSLLTVHDIKTYAVSQQDLLKQNKLDILNSSRKLKSDVCEQQQDMVYLLPGTSESTDVDKKELLPLIVYDKEGTAISNLDHDHDIALHHQIPNPKALMGFEEIIPYLLSTSNTPWSYFYNRKWGLDTQYADKDRDLIIISYLTALSAYYTKTKNSLKLRQVIGTMVDCDLPSRLSDFENLISLLLKEGQINEVSYLMAKLGEFGHTPSNFIYKGLMESLIKEKLFIHAVNVAGQMRIDESKLDRQSW